MNFDRLRFVAERAELGEGREAILSVQIPERPGSFIQLHGVIHPRATTEFIYRYDDEQVAQIFVSFKLETTNRAQEVEDVLKDLTALDFKALDISDDELAKTHTRYMIGGRKNVANERIFRFGTYFITNYIETDQTYTSTEFPERPGALRKFLEGIQTEWNISLFHYRNHGSGKFFSPTFEKILNRQLFSRSWESARGYSSSSGAV